MKVDLAFTKCSTLVKGLQLLHLFGGSTGTLNGSGRAHPLAGFDWGLLVSLPQRRPLSLQGRFHPVRSTNAVVLLLPREDGGASLASCDVFVAHADRRLTRHLKTKHLLEARRRKTTLKIKGSSQFTHFDLQDFEFSLQLFPFFHFLVVFLLQLLQSVIWETQNPFARYNETDGDFLKRNMFLDTNTKHRRYVTGNKDEVKYRAVWRRGQEPAQQNSFAEWTAAAQRRTTKRKSRQVENDPSHFCTF